MGGVRFGIACVGVAFSVAASGAEGRASVDVISSGADAVSVTLYGHASLRFAYHGMMIYVDPVAEFVGDGKLEKADLILVTHDHDDHFDSALIARLSKPGTEVVANEPCVERLKWGHALANGQRISVLGVGIEAVPAYNTSKEKLQFHPKGRDNGYVITLGSERVYVAGDTEDIPELSALKEIDVAFLPVNLPYTMTVAQLAHAIAMVSPRIAYPYHTGDTDQAKLAAAMGKVAKTEVRIRPMR